MPLTPSQTRILLDSLDHRPRKQLGQNFLIDGNIVRKSIQLANLQRGDHVVEIGPGLGTLTEAMLQAGCHVHAVELDPRLAEHLRNIFQSRISDTIDLIEGDAVKYPRAGLPAEIPAYKVVANLPYAITTPWLESILRGHLATEMVLMMQKEAASRITAGPGSKAFGAISIFVGASYERMGLHHVSRSCFYPVPGVDSVLLHLRVKQSPVIFNSEARDLIRSLFTQRRKQIGRIATTYPALQHWLDGLDAFGCSSSSRSEDIPLDAWISLNNSMGNLQ